MAIYDTEEEQVEALKRWWKDNAQAVIFGAIAGLGLIFGTDYWKTHQQEQRLEASSLYQQLTAAEAQGQAEQVEKLGTSISTQYDSTAYATYAQLFQAKMKVQQGDLPAAKALLEKVVATADAPLNNVARLRLISLQLASGEYEQGLKEIASIDAASMTGFSANYEELKGDLYVALNRLDEARTAYENALREGSQSPLLQFKLDDLTALPIKPPSIADNSNVEGASTAPVVTEPSTEQPKP